MVLQQILTILITSPGNLIVHLALAFAMMATLQAVLAVRRTIPGSVTARLIFGLNAILIGQLVLFASSGVAWQNLADPQTFLPPLDRAVMAWSLVWIVWLWLFPNNKSLADISNAVLNLGLMILFLFTLTAWREQGAATSFNGTWFDLAWMGLSAAICLFGLVWLIYARPNGWGIAIGILGLNLIGIVLHVSAPDPNSSYPAWVRLAQLCSFPLLPGIVQRHALSAQTSAEIEQTRPEETRSDKRRYTADQRAVANWVQLASAQEPVGLRKAVTRAVAQTMLADLCFLVPNKKELVLESGYDLVRDEELPDIPLFSEQLPTIIQAVLRGRSLIFDPTNPPHKEMQILADVLELENPGSLLLVPLANETANWGSLMLLSPYSDRDWNGADQSYLATITDGILAVVNRPAAGATVVGPADLETIQAELTDIRNEYDRLQVENRLLIERLEQLDQKDGRTPEIESLLALQHETEEQVNRLQQENDQLQARLLTSTTTVGSAPSEAAAQIEGELRLSLEEIAHLQNALAGANMKILALEMQARHTAPIDPQSMEVIASTVQELRQPITSIIGYTDLILSETVGILGTLQRKFLERIRSSTEKMKSLLDDLIMVTALEGKVIEISPSQVNMAAVIDRAVEATNAQFREKELTLELDLPETLPALSADQDALEQIITHLLQNAAVVTPHQGTVRLEATQTKEEQDYLLLKVTDQGGGIAPEHMPRVFWRNFRAENPLIQGIGDRGIGLSIAKALVETLGGRIWAESIQGKSTTFSILLPITTLNETIDGGRDETAA